MSAVNVNKQTCVIGRTSLVVMAEDRIASCHGFIEAVDIVTEADLRVTGSACWVMNNIFIRDR
jgi:hypothetical protein